MTIDKHITLQDLVRLVPDSIGLLNRKGIRCFACEESMEGTLEEAAKEKGFTDEDIALLAKELNYLL